MKKLISSLLICLLVPLSSCTNFKDEGAGLGGVSVDSKTLSLDSGARESRLTVQSGEKWEIATIPSWIKVKNIWSYGYQWELVLSVEANAGHDRSGTLTLRSKSSSAAVTVTQEGTMGYENGHEWVDLGLSVKWATCNVGAGSPEGYGNYYAWGETTTKSEYAWSTYKWCNGSSNTLTKYNNNSSYGTVDNRIRLELSDDAARANWGGKWRMPTDAEWWELLNNCSKTWTKKNGVYGCTFTRIKNGNSVRIFLPAAGNRIATGLNGAGGSGGYYGSSSLDTDDPGNAWRLYFSSGGVLTHFGNRYIGWSVRPVTE